MTADAALNGAELPVDSSAIEKSLSELWRSEKEGDHAVMRAALWNVVAHTGNPRDHSKASDVLSRASESVPQRAIIIRAEPKAPSEITSWISANCHLVAGEKQVCSEEIAIVAGGSRVRHVPPLVNALLIPDMPVAVWWIGDLPNDDQTYVEALLDTADHLIVDSTHFDSVSDIALVRRIGEKTVTAPADLNWVRLEDWRIATASLFDPPAMRERLLQIKRLRIVAAESENDLFGNWVESLYFAAWINVQSDPGRRNEIRYEFELEKAPCEAGSVTQVQIEFTGGSEAIIRRDYERGVLTATIDGSTVTFDSVTRLLGRHTHQVIVRQLKRPEADRVFVKLLPIAIELASRIA